MLGLFSYNYTKVWHDQKEYCSFWLNINPDNHGPNFWLGHYYLEDNNFTLARKYLNKAITNTFMDWEVYNNFGLMHAKENDNVKAIFQLQKIYMT